MKFPQIKTKHFLKLSDDFGIWQHTNGDVVYKKKGYALDDAARALIVAANNNFFKEGKVFIKFIEKSFLYYSNFFDENKNPIDIPVSDDAAGEAFWALGYCIDRGFLREDASQLAEEISLKIEKMENLRAVCYAVIGSSYFSKEKTKKLSQKMRKLNLLKVTSDWCWPEESLNYGNAIIPYAYLKSFGAIKDPDLLETGLRYLDFLNKKTKYYRRPIAIGNKGWYQKGNIRNLYDQQPIDPAYQVLANLSAFKITSKNEYLKEAITYYLWFWGNNLKKMPMVDLFNESVSDGLQEKGPSVNRGAESIVCYLIAQNELLKS